jgi:hypothetical protein
MGDLLPAGDAGTFTVSSDEFEAVADDIPALEALLLDEGERRGIRIQWRRDPITGDVTYRWRPEHSRRRAE